MDIHELLTAEISCEVFQRSKTRMLLSCWTRDNGHTQEDRESVLFFYKGLQRATLDPSNDSGKSPLEPPPLVDGCI